MISLMTTIEALQDEGVCNSVLPKVGSVPVTGKSAMQICIDADAPSALSLLYSAGSMWA